jgi:hypothetical protein
MHPTVNVQFEREGSQGLLHRVANQVRWLKISGIQELGEGGMREREISKSARIDRCHFCGTSLLFSGIAFGQEQADPGAPEECVYAN